VGSKCLAEMPWNLTAVGGDWSCLIVTLLEEVPPALVAVQVSGIAPSAATGVGLPQPLGATTGDCASPPLQFTRTGTVYQPFAPFGVGGFTLREMAGGLVS